MSKRFAFEIKITGVLLAALLMVTATGFLAYKSLTGIVENVSGVARPDTKLTLLKQIFSDLSDAESSVKSYNLTQNSDYLSPFYSSITAVDDRMNELKRLSRNNSSQRMVADSINNLIEKRYKLLHEMLNLHYDVRIIDELKKISIAIERKKKPEGILSEEKESNIFKRIFGRKDLPSLLPVPETQTVNLQYVQQEIEQAKEKQAQQLDENHKKELLLTQQGKEVMDHIRSLIAQMEKEELNVIAQKTTQAENSAKQTNTLITVFCAAIIFLLFIVSYVIASYVRKNKEYGKALSKAKTEAENLAKARENFLATMSHEIRTPMNAIAGFTEQVLQSGLSTEQKNQLTVVKKSADHLLKIINDVLDFSKIQAGKLKIEQYGFLLHEIVNDVILLMSPQAKGKELNLAYRIESNVPEILIGDGVRLKQILLNLISNSIKFTEQGKISLHLSATSPNENKITLSIEIEDTGIGIPQEKLEHIFDEFEQAHNSISKNYGGTGLGLTITKKLVEIQDGSISISSEPSKGTIIRISIPYAIGSKNDLEKAEIEIIDNGLLKGKNVLVADDEAYNRLLISTIIKKWGAHITESKTGEEVLKEVRNNQYDIILMDIRMPGMDGIKTCQQIRQMQDKKKANTPVIALTAVTSAEDIARCKQAGMNDFLAKPFKEKDLHQRIVSVLFGEAKSKDVLSYSNGNHSTSEKKYCLDDLKRMIRGDEKFLNEMIGIFIGSMQEAFSEMNKASAEKNWSRIADFSHKIIAPCIHFEAKNLVAILRTMENNIRNSKDIESVPSLLKQASSEADAIVQDLKKIVQSYVPA